MDEPSIEVRYGAFNALRTLDPSDPFLGLVRVMDEPKLEDDDDGTARLDGPGDRDRLAPTPRRQDDPFALYVVDSEGPPLVHVSRTRRCEIVVFGRTQKLLTPVVLGTGPISLNAADNDEKIEISKIVPSQFGDADTKITSTLELARGASGAWPTWAPATPRSSPSSRRPSARRTWPASWSSTPFPSPTPNTSKPCWAKTSPASATTP